VASDTTTDVEQVIVTNAWHTDKVAVKVRLGNGMTSVTQRRPYRVLCGALATIEQPALNRCSSLRQPLLQLGDA
jgi:hypothetical protein